MASFLVISMLFGQFAWITSATDKITPERFEEKANLALRRTGHHLLLVGGDLLHAFLRLRNSMPTRM